MLVFLVAVAGLAFVLHEDLLRVFQHTPMLDSVILGVLLLGIFFVFRQVIILWPEVQLDAPLPAPRGRRAAAGDRVGQPAGADGRHAGRAARPDPAVADRQRARCSTASPPASTSAASWRAT